MKPLFVGNRGTLSDAGAEFSASVFRHLHALVDGVPGDIDIHHAELLVLGAVTDLFTSKRITDSLKRHIKYDNT